MEAQEFLESGLVELTAMGLATETEAALVLEMRTKHTVVEQAWQAAAEDIYDTLVAADVPKKAPARLKNNLFDTISKETAPVVALDSTTVPTAKVVPINNNRWQWLAAASVVLVMVSASANMWMYNKLKSTESQLASLEQERTVLTASFKKATDETQKMSNQLAMASDPGMPRVVMGGMNTAKSAEVLVVWDPTQNKVQLGIKNLPQVPTNKDLQLWAIVDGKPMSCGLISMKEGEMIIEHSIPNVTNPQAFAVTLEDKGGHDQPEGEMWLMGKVSS